MPLGFAMGMYGLGWRVYLSRSKPTSISTLRYGFVRFITRLVGLLGF